MKKIFSLALAAFGFIAPALAQQTPYFTHFAYNRLFYNPAVAGTDSAFNISALLHQQWAGFDGNAGPSSQMLIAHTPVFGNQGIGIEFLNDKLSHERTLNIALSYSFQFNVGKTATLSVGPKLIGVQKSFDGTQLDPERAGDPTVPTNNVSAMAPEVGAGIYLFNNNNRWYAGLSSLNLIGSDLKYSVGANNMVYQMRRTYFANAGLRLPVAPAVALMPNVLVKSDVTNTQVDAQLEVMLANIIRVGGAWRSSDAISLMGGIYLKKRLHIGYSYDITLSNLNQASNGSHEIFLAYRMPFMQKAVTTPWQSSPRYF